jgi:hypothetical protein
VKVGAFLTCQTLDKAIAECQRARNGSVLDWQQFLKRVRVQCVHNPSRTFAIAGFGNKPLAEEEGLIFISEKIGKIYKFLNIL